MLSIVITYVKEQHLNQNEGTTSYSVLELGGSDDIKHLQLHISTNKGGELVEANQLHH